MLLVVDFNLQRKRLICTLELEWLSDFSQCGETDGFFHPSVNTCSFIRRINPVSLCINKCTSKYVDMYIYRIFRSSLCDIIGLLTANTFAGHGKINFQIFEKKFLGFVQACMYVLQIIYTFKSVGIK